MLNFSSAIAYNNPITGKEKNLKMKLSGYGSAATGLQEDKMYIVSCRLVVSKRCTTGVLYYDSELNVLISDSKTFTTSLANKTAFWGFGIIVLRSEVTEPGATSNVLMVTLRHTDYDNAVSRWSFHHFIFDDAFLYFCDLLYHISFDVFSE
jgi:hypothetical protein